MGQPKKQRRNYGRPRKRYDSARIEEEGNLVKRYALKNKKEVWMARAEIARIGTNARELLAKKDERIEEVFLARLYRLGLLQKPAGLDQALKLNVENLLERRLQTQVFRLGFSNSIKQSRQVITHGHIAVNNQRVSVPSYLVTVEDKVLFYSGSKVASETHPMRVKKAKSKKKEGETGDEKRDAKEEKPTEKKEDRKEEVKEEQKQEEPKKKEEPKEEKKEGAKPEEKKEEAKPEVKEEKKEEVKNG